MAGPTAINNDINAGNVQSLTPELQRIYFMTAQAEKKNIEKIEERKQNVVEKNNLLTDILGKVDAVRKLVPGLSTPSSLRELNVASGDDKVVVGTADKSVADLGKHSVEVLQLATGARAFSNRFEDKDKTRIGSGYFTFNTVDGEQKEVFIDNENSTLEGIARILNTSNAGIRASVVNDASDPDSPYRLLMTAEGVGAGKDVEFPEFYFLDGDQDFTIDEKKPATNAKIRYQGLEFESPTNELKDLIPGVTLNLKGITQPDRPVGVSIEQDIPKTATKMKDLVDKLNDVFGFIQKQNKMDEHTNSQKTLGGDYALRMSESRLHDALLADLADLRSSRAIKIMQDIGVTFNKGGTLDFDQKKFENSINQNYAQVADLLTGDGVRPGIMNKLNNALNMMAQPGVGVLANEKKNYTERIMKIDQEIDDKDKKGQKKLEDLRGKLGRIQGALQEMQSQSASFAGMSAGSPLAPAGMPSRG